MEGILMISSHVKRCDVSEEEFERRHALVQDEVPWDALGSMVNLVVKD